MARIANVRQGCLRYAQSCGVFAAFFLLVLLHLYCSPAWSERMVEPSKLQIEKSDSPDTTKPLVDSNVTYLHFPTDSNLAAKLWRARIGSRLTTGEDKIRAELQRLIAQVRSIRFAHRQERKTAATDSSQNQVSEANVPVITTPKTAGTIKEKTPHRPQSPTLRTASLDFNTVEVLAKNPEQAQDPLVLAEVLFAGGRKKLAAVFYQEALNRDTKKGEKLSAEDKAWALFQAANCLREKDMTAAEKLYLRLIAEYPDCPWVEIAKAQCKLIEWYQHDKPRLLVDSLADNVDVGRTVSKAGP